MRGFQNEGLVVKIFHKILIIFLEDKATQIHNACSKPVTKYNCHVCMEKIVGLAALTLGLW